MELGKSEVVVGGQQYTGKEDYLRTLNTIFNRLALCNRGGNYKEFFWEIDYCTNLLVNSVIDPKARNRLAKAKSDIFAIELLKRTENPLKFNSVEELKKKLSDDDVCLAGIDGCLKIVGAIRTYSDRYWGLETKVSVLVGDDIQVVDIPDLGEENEEEQETVDFEGDDNDN